MDVSRIAFVQIHDDTSALWSQLPHQLTLITSLNVFKQNVQTFNFKHVFKLGKFLIMSILIY